MLKPTLRRKGKPEKFGERLHQFSREKGVCLSPWCIGRVNENMPGQYSIVVSSIRICWFRYRVREKRKAQGRLQSIEKLRRQNSH